MEGRHKPNPNIYKAGVSIDEAKYHRELKNGKIVMTDAGKRWAREWDAVRLPIHVLLRFGT